MIRSLIRKDMLLAITIAVILFLFVIISGQIMFNNKVSALSGSQFNAGRIIDDAIFFNSTSMSPQQIQNFLNSKVPSCDTNGTQIYTGSTTRAAYGTSRGYPPPYVCLRYYSQKIPTVTNSGSDLCKGSITGGTKSAASIIYDVARACDINPQVLIVLLQKEQSLVTDDWPWSIQYRSATGYGCPDTAPCDSQYYGFFNQVYQAAQAFRRYEANPASFNYRAGRNNTILWNPNASCGSSTVYIENQATANLYIYTPYRPNQAALNNLYGEGDGCSSYGNRNFWRMFNDWFGATNAPYLSHNPVSASSTSNTSTMITGSRVRITLKVRNTGNKVWSNTNTRLGTAGPNDRQSDFRDSTWISGNRAATLSETTVQPGDIGTFIFWYKAPNMVGNFNEKFSVVIEGVGWTPYAGLYLNTNVVAPDFSASMVSLATYKNSSLSVQRNTSNMAPSEKAYIVLRVKNSGNQTWRNSGANTTLLATAGPNGRASAYNYGWLSSSRVVTMDQSSVGPGQVATFRFWYRAPSIYGSHSEKFTLVHEGKAWSNYFGFNLNTKVERPKPSGSPVSATSSSPTGTMKKGALSYITFKLRNTGNNTWYRANTNLGTAEPTGRISNFRYSSWLSANRTTKLTESSVAPGEVGTFKFWYQAPNNTGLYTEYFTPVQEGISWFSYSGLYLKTNVVN